MTYNYTSIIQELETQVRKLNDTIKIIQNKVIKLYDDRKVELQLIHTKYSMLNEQEILYNSCISTTILLIDTQIQKCNTEIKLYIESIKKHKKEIDDLKVNLVNITSNVTFTMVRPPVSWDWNFSYNNTENLDGSTTISFNPRLIDKDDIKHDYQSGISTVTINTRWDSDTSFKFENETWRNINVMFKHGEPNVTGEWSYKPRRREERHYGHTSYY
jgi:hypothetical protein